jgi:CRP-like cAMP-binding protein
VFGDMAILEGERRSATVLADTEIVCLALTTAAFADLQEQHPRIASKLLLNLARMLASRLRITSTERQEKESD